MAKFAKLFELPNNEQVLVIIEYNNDNEKFEVILKTDFWSYVAEMKHGFIDKDPAIKMFENYTMENAIDFRNNLSKTLG